MSGGGRIAIVHDSFAQHREADRVVEEIGTLLPQADLLSAMCIDERLRQSFESRVVAKTSWMKYLPRADRFHRRFPVLYPLAIRRLDLSGYSIVISSCLGFARAAACPDDAVHLCYCHAPARSLWRDRGFPVSAQRSAGAGLLLLPLLAGLLRIDAALSAQPDYYIAKSGAVAEDIRRCYGRNAFVIYPPIDMSRYHPAATVEDFYLIASPLLSYTRIDAVIAACNSTGSRLLIAGEGPDRRRIETLAGPTVEFLGARTEDEIAQLTASSLAVFCFDSGEDFDTMPLKANAAGRPAIALATSTARETIIDGESGVLYRNCSRPAIVEAMKECTARTWDAEGLRKYSRRFDAAAFRSRFLEMLEDIVGTQSVLRAVA